MREDAGSTILRPSSPGPALSPASESCLRCPSKIGLAIFSSSTMCAARRIFSCSPSGNTTPLRMRLRLLNHHVRDLVRLAQPAFKLVAVLIERNGIPRHARSHGRFRHRRRLPQQYARDRTASESGNPDQTSAAPRRRRGTPNPAHLLSRDAASARVAASFISSLIAVACTSSAPRKINGKPSTLFT